MLIKHVLHRNNFKLFNSRFQENYENCIRKSHLLVKQFEKLLNSPKILIRNSILVNLSASPCRKLIFQHDSQFSTKEIPKAHTHIFVLRTSDIRTRTCQRDETGICPSRSLLAEAAKERLVSPEQRIHFKSPSSVTVIYGHVACRRSSWPHSVVFVGQAGGSLTWFSTLQSRV